MYDVIGIIIIVFGFETFFFFCLLPIISVRNTNDLTFKSRTNHLQLTDMAFLLHPFMKYLVWLIFELTTSCLRYWIISLEITSDGTCQQIPEQPPRLSSECRRENRSGMSNIMVIVLHKARLVYLWKEKSLFCKTIQLFGIVAM